MLGWKTRRGAGHPPFCPVNPYGVGSPERRTLFISGNLEKPKGLPTAFPLGNPYCNCGTEVSYRPLEKLPYKPKYKTTLLWPDGEFLHSPGRLYGSVWTKHIATISHIGYGIRDTRASAQQMVELLGVGEARAS